MLRDEKGKFVKASVSPKYKVYSDLLQKPFDSVEELEAAEAEVRKAEEEKKAAAAARKAEATKVEDAYKALNAAKREYNEGMLAAKKEYLKEASEAKEKYNKTCDDLRAPLELANEKYSDALDEFIKAHPEGYHVTLKDGDNTTTISGHADNDFFTDFFNCVFRNF